MKCEKTLFVYLRFAMSWLFLWPFLDKLFGLGFSTKQADAWLFGGSPTTGFLKFGTDGPFAFLFQQLAGQAWVDWIFMLGLLGIGLAFLLGIAQRIAAYSGSLLLLLMWLATFPPDHNPFLDEHLIFLITLLLLAEHYKDRSSGFSKAWRQTKLVKQFPILR
jgi:thiosulfate dehydrogenase [quinone] large subunit